MEISYIGLGSCCSPAAALRGLQLRNYALPFDWVVSSISALQTCILDDFKSYHTHLYITNKRTRIIDKYGFEFPHDYPTIDVCDNIHIGEGIISETHILDGWEQYSDCVREKYLRRIERFNTILTSDNPIIALYRGTIHNIPILTHIFKTKYNKSNIIFVVATKEISTQLHVITCDPERDGEWNSHSIWLEGIKAAQKNIIL